MKSKIKWLIALIILVLLAGLYSVVDKKTPIYDTEIDNSEYFSVDLREGDRISQSFLAPEDTLDGVMIKMAAVGNLEGTIWNTICLKAEERLSWKGKLLLVN